MADAITRRVGGREAFEAQAVAMQRQAVRYVLDVRSPEARVRRAEQMTDSILKKHAKRRRTREEILKKSSERAGPAGLR